MVVGQHGFAAADEASVLQEREQNRLLSKSALIEWHLLSKERGLVGGGGRFAGRKLSSTSGISASTTKTQTSCCMTEDETTPRPPLVQNTSLSDESKMKMKISRKELASMNRIDEAVESTSSTYNKGNDKPGCFFSAEESNSSFASLSSDHLGGYQKLPSPASNRVHPVEGCPREGFAPQELRGQTGERRGGSLEGGPRADDSDTDNQDLGGPYGMPKTSALAAGGLNMNIIKQAAIAGMEAASDAPRQRSFHQTASSHYEAIDVIKAMADLATQCKVSMKDVFNHFDRDKDHMLDREDLLMMIRQLLPSLSVHERCYLIENLIAFHPSGGQLSYPDIKRICALIGTQTSPNGSHAMRGWPSDVHTSVATIHSSDFSAFNGSSKISSYSQSSFTENEASAAQKQAQWQLEAEAIASNEQVIAALNFAEQGPPAGEPGQRVNPLTKARRRSSLMLGDALLQLKIQDEDNSGGAVASPQNAKYAADDSVIQKEETPPKVQMRMQSFLGSSNSQMKLMARGELPATLKEIFQLIYADGSDFLQANSVSEMSLEVSKWCKSFVHGGYIRTIKMVTQHPRLGTLQTLDTQRMIWGNDKRTLVVENRTMTPDFPNGLQWRVERRCVYVQVSPEIVLLTITAGVHIVHYFVKANQLQKTVERTLPEDARSHFQGIYNSVMIRKSY